MSQLHLSPLRHFLAEFTRLVAEPHAESTRLELGTALLRELIADDRWLASEFAQPHPEYYQQYLLYADPLSRFSVVSFVWGPGQKTPIHDHRVWGLIGMLRGAESSQTFVIESDGTACPNYICRRCDIFWQNLPAWWPNLMLSRPALNWGLHYCGS